MADRVLLEGLLVDLVPMGDSYKQKDHVWQNSIGSYFWHMGEYIIVTKSQLERRYEHRREQSERDRHRVHFGIQTKDGKLIGRFGYAWLDLSNRLGILTALIGEPEYWGGGYGTDALLLAVQYGFDWLDLHKVFLMTMQVNARVLRQMEKVGFMRETQVREATWVDGEWVDAVTFGMLREEWPGRAALVEKLGLQAKAGGH